MANRYASAQQCADFFFESTTSRVPRMILAITYSQGVPRHKKGWSTLIYTKAMYKAPFMTKF